MMSYCCGGGREEEQGPSKTLRRPTSEGGLNWLSEASSQWQGEPDSGDGATTFGWGHNDTTLTIEVLRSKRLRSGFTNVHFLGLLFVSFFPTEQTTVAFYVKQQLEKSIKMRMP